MVQAMMALCLALWIGYGVWQFRRATALRERLERIPRGRRVGLAALAMVGGVTLLFGGLLLLPAIGLATADELRPGAWPLVALLGLVCVHLQTLATALLVTVALSAPRRDPGTAARNGNIPPDVEPPDTSGAAP